MDKEKRNKVELLAGSLYEKKLVFECLGLANTSGKTFEERKQQTIDYEIARAEMMEAEARLARVRLN
jgi:hypothetical protein